MKLVTKVIHFESELDESNLSISVINGKIQIEMFDRGMSKYIIISGDLEQFKQEIGKLLYE